MYFQENSSKKILEGYLKDMRDLIRKFTKYSGKEMEKWSKAKHVLMKVQERNAIEFFGSHTRSKTMESPLDHWKKITFSSEFYAESCSQNSVE